jgi:hypothetical protein
MISGPRAFSCSVVNDLTDASVPTGMKTGVWMVPWRVVIWPRRAGPSVCRSWKVRRDIGWQLAVDSWQ